MAYGNKNGRLPYEKASKLGHLSIINSEWIQSLIDDFESIDDPLLGREELEWEKKKIDNKYITDIWVVDGSFVPVTSSENGDFRKPAKEVAFIKTALLKLDFKSIESIDPISPHPQILRDLMDNSAVYHSTVLPLKNIKSSKGNNYDTVRHIIYDSIKYDCDGEFFETLKWIIYKKWNPKMNSSPKFECPHCRKINDGMLYDSEKEICSFCGKEILLTDVLGFYQNMNEESAQEIVASSYMSIMEHLMLFTAIRLLWDCEDKTLINNTLFIKDGPLTLPSQYAKLIPNIREFIKFSMDNNRLLNIIACEKSGRFFEHIKYISKYTEELNNDEIMYKIMTHGYIVNEVYRIAEQEEEPGHRTRWGERVLVKVDSDTFLVLNIPVYEFKKDKDAPYKNDIVGLDIILNTIPHIISRKYEGALLPVELANGIASLSSYPSAKILQYFISKK